MMKVQKEQLLYLLNMVLLFAHEIDSAYWQEWELFGLPGGIQLFVILNLVLILFFLVGYGHLLQGRRRGHFYALLLAGTGLFAFTIHVAFLLAGDPAFRLPVSLLLLVLAFVISILQAISAVRALRRERILRQ